MCVDRREDGDPRLARWRGAALKKPLPRVAWGLQHGAAVAALALAVACAGCSDGGSDQADGDAAELVAYDQAWQIATHNSYWVDRGTPNDLFASGVGERILDQILRDGVRTVEIDVHADPARPGVFTVFHTVPGNSVCATLADCLATLRALGRAVPRHEVVTAIVELKGILEPTFDARHTPADLDRIARDELGDRLFSPRDLLARCPEVAGAPSPALSDCAAAAGWPRAAELRGRVIVAILGNWDDLGGAQATRDWVDYATAAPIAERAAFPMASSWKLDRAALPPRLQAIVSPTDLDRALAQSVFLQIEDLADPRIEPFLARRGVIRVNGAFAAADQAERVARGMQLLQTDFPWVTVDGAGPEFPLRPLSGADPTGVGLREPGERIALEAPAGGLVFAQRDDGRSAVWEATVTGDAEGCLRAASGLDSDADSVAVCRRKVRSGARAAAVSVAVVRQIAGVGREDVYEAPLDALGGPGDLLRLDVVPSGERGSCAAAWSTDLVAGDGEPRWVRLGEAVCAPTALRHRGVAALAAVPAARAVFTGIRRGEGPGTLEAIGADELEVVAIGAPAPIAARSAPQ